MKICVIGGTGNISSAFIPVLLEKGHDVTCFNRGISAKVPSGAQWIHPQNLRFIQGDRSDRAAFEKTMQQEKFDAAIDMIGFNQEDAHSSLRAFRGVQHFIFCSTVCVYGNQYDSLPVSENHPLRPVTSYGKEKAEAEQVFREAFEKDGFPVTIVRPSTTFGPLQGAIRQIGWDYSWIDRIRKGKPVVVCDEGLARHQFLHVGDAALCFANLPGKQHCIGQTYNMTKKGYTTWKEYHLTAMEVLGRQVELAGIPFATLDKSSIPEFDLCREIFAHHTYYNSDRLFHDVPEFQPAISLASALADTIADMDKTGRVPNSDSTTWEDDLLKMRGK
jgi:nucleoside-diphosphate-sugar epimerase